jgi:aspartyl-tRNA(Asn)/glutamyl-tRNA(Gln) amidotransferase subunit A
MSGLNELTIAAARDALRRGEVTSVELTEACLAAIEAAGALNAFVHKTPEIARESAAAADARLRAGAAPAMCGIPIGIKDLFCTKGVPSQAGSNILRNFRPEYESTVSQQLRDAGAVMLGKLNMDEFAMGSSNETSCYGNAVNPWRRAGDPTPLTPGGSSGGSAAAVAADLCAAALGTDTGGSIRQPAAFCGVVGIKPTYGLVSRYGVIAFASSLDQVGPLSKTVRDSALLLEVLAGHDPLDSTSIARTPGAYLRACERGPAGLRIGVPSEYFGAGIDPEVEAAVRGAIARLGEAGASIVPVSLPHTRFAVAAYYLICTAEASSNLARFDGVRFGQRRAGAEAGSGDLAAMYSATRGEGFGPEVKRRIMLGTFALSAGYYEAYYGRAQKVRTLIRRDFEDAFQRCDLIATPTSPVPAFRLGERLADPLQMYLADIFTISCNLAGLPGLSLPCGLTPGAQPIRRGGPIMTRPRPPYST